MKYPGNWSKWVEEGLNMLMDAVISEKDDVHEISSGRLDAIFAAKISVTSEDVNLHIDFTESPPSYKITAPRNVKKDAVDLNVERGDNANEIVVIRRSSREAQNLTVWLQLPNQYEYFTVIAGNADVVINECKVPNVNVSTVSGDIVIRNHFNQCTIEAESNKGDVVKSLRFEKSLSYKLVCTSETGDIVVE